MWTKFSLYVYINIFLIYIYVKVHFLVVSQDLNPLSCSGQRRRGIDAPSSCGAEKAFTSPLFHSIKGLCDHWTGRRSSEWRCGYHCTLYSHVRTDHFHGSLIWVIVFMDFFSISKCFKYSNFYILFKCPYLVLFLPYVNNTVFIWSIPLVVFCLIWLSLFRSFSVFPSLKADSRWKYYALWNHTVLQSHMNSLRNVSDIIEVQKKKK